MEAQYSNDRPTVVDIRLHLRRDAVGRSELNRRHRLLGAILKQHGDLSSGTELHLLPLRPAAYQGGEGDPNYLQVQIDHQHIRPSHVIHAAERHDQRCHVEDHREHEVRECDPEESAEASTV